MGHELEKRKPDIANKVEIPRSLTIKQEPIKSVDVHIFGNPGFLGYCTVAYPVVNQPSKVNQGLVGSKFRLLKTDIAIPKLDTAQKTELRIEDFFSLCDQIGRKLRIWSH